LQLVIVPLLRTIPYILDEVFIVIGLFGIASMVFIGYSGEAKTAIFAALMAN
jgi:hypothetical protein